MALFVTLAAAPRAGAFCGFYVARAKGDLFNRSSRVVLVRRGERTVITMVSDYRGDPESFALVVPVPTVLEREDIQIVDPAVVDHLDAFTAPRLVTYEGSDRRSGFGGGLFAEEAPDPATTTGVRVEAEYAVGEYDVKILAAAQSRGLLDWLNEHGYRTPERAKPILADYLDRGMRFFVAQVNLERREQEGYQSLRPLRIAFESPRFMLPIRLGTVNADGPQDLIVYAITAADEGRVMPANYPVKPIPTEIEVPGLVEERFGAFYQAMFDRRVEEAEETTVFLEHAWDMSWCDPCASDPLTSEELQELGVDWISEEASATGKAGAQDAFVTRLHMRYGHDVAKDLALEITGDLERFQGRYIMAAPPDPTLDFQGVSKARMEEQGKRLARLTGWDLEEIREEIEAVQRRRYEAAKRVRAKRKAQLGAMLEHTLIQIIGEEAVEMIHERVGKPEDWARFGGEVASHRLVGPWLLVWGPGSIHAQIPETLTAFADAKGGKMYHAVGDIEALGDWRDRGWARIGVAQTPALLEMRRLTLPPPGTLEEEDWLVPASAGGAWPGEPKASPQVVRALLEAAGKEVEPPSSSHLVPYRLHALLDEADPVQEPAHPEAVRRWFERAGLRHAGIEEKLDRRVTLAWEAAPLAEALAELHRRADLPMFVDWGALQEAGVARTSPVTLRAEKTRVRDLLAALLRQVTVEVFNPADFRIEAGLIHVEPWVAAPYPWTLRVFDMAGAVDRDERRAWVDTVRTHVGREEEWAAFGGHVASARLYKDRLAIRAPHPMVREAIGLLAFIRGAPPGREPAPGPPLERLYPDPADREIARRLEKRIDVAWDEATRFAEALEDVGERAGITIELKSPELADWQDNLLEARQVPARRVLKMLLRRRWPRDVDGSIRQGRVVVEKLEEMPTVTRRYEVPDLFESGARDEDFFELADLIRAHAGGSEAWRKFGGRVARVRRRGDALEIEAPIAFHRDVVRFLWWMRHPL